jgi:hypothetical protein
MSSEASRSSSPSSEEPLASEPEVRSLARPWLLALVGVLVGYPLSPAPVIWSLQKAGWKSIADQSELFYWPIVVVYRNVPLVQAFYDWQFELLGIRP